MKLLISLLLSMGILASCQHRVDTPIHTQLSQNWEVSSDSIKALRATVPGTVYTDLLTAALIPDPFVLTNEAKVQWVAEQTWTYRTTFELTKAVRSRKHHLLNFEGIDTYADIYLNEQYIGTTNNAFTSYVYEVDSLLKASNTLRIVVHPIQLQETKAKALLSYQLPESPRVFTRKAQFQYGWDWGPKLQAVGIWKPVSLQSWNDVLLRDCYLQQEALQNNLAQLKAHLEFTSDSAKTLVIKTSIAGVQEEHPLEIIPGTHTYTLPLTIKNPVLWYPHTMGTPHRYRIHFDIFDEQVLTQSFEKKIGLRTLQLHTPKDSLGEQFYFSVNGKPIYAKGANYIPQHSFQNNVSPKHYEKLLQAAVEANMNMLRVWGGGIYEEDAFYDLCDEKGILVWQDFMFACAMYPGDKAFLKNVQREAEQQVKRLRNYASIALWCGNNENSEGWHRWGWQDGRSADEKKAIWTSYQQVFDSLLPKTVARLHPGTSYWESSPKYGRGNPKYEFEGDAHDWWVWHDAAPFEHFEKRIPRFMSEFGFQSYPSPAVINYINQDTILRLKGPAIRSHQKHQRGFQLLSEYRQRDFPYPKSAIDTLYLSQLVQARGIAIGIEAHRRAKPYNMGSLYWQLNDCWPAISWSSIDYFGHWKALHYQAKRSFANILISGQHVKNTYRIYIVNDSAEQLEDELTIEILDFDGHQKASYQQRVRIPPNSSTHCFTVALDTFDHRRQFIKSSFGTLRRNHYLNTPKNLQLSKVKIEKQLSKTATGWQVELKSSSLAKAVYLYTNTEGHFSDNFFDLTPGVSKIIQFKCSENTTPNIRIKTLNELL